MPSSIGNGNAGQAAELGRKDRTWQMRKYLLLLAILVATVTYVAGMDPPGGVWLETEDGHRAGDPILPDTRPIRYRVFYHVNATAFAASLVIIVLLLFLRKDAMRTLLAVRVAMVLDLVCLMLAYVTGACRGTAITVVASALSAAVILLVLVAIWLQHYAKKAAAGTQKSSRGRHLHREGRKILMLVSIFATTATYTAGLSPPGGFWEHDHGHRAGDPILLERQARCFLAFLVCNTTAFAASLVTMTLLLSRQLSKVSGHLSAPYVCVAVALIGLLGAYAAGSCRETDTAVGVYVLCLVGAVLVCISIIAYIENQCTLASQAPEGEGLPDGASRNGEADTNPLDKARSLILLLATLTVTVTYQAGLNPPGGVWKETGDGHVSGGLVLLETHTRRYKAFFYCNSAAFVASIVVFIMVQSRSLVSQGGRHALEAAVILDLLALVGAYGAGSCRDVRTSIYVFALAAVVFVYVVIHVVIEKSSSDSTVTTVSKEEVELDKKRKLLLLLAILVVTITYQAGLTPPGKFWLEHGSGDEAHKVGDPVLADNYPRRYKAFFYSNTTSFMASVAVTVFLLSRNLSNTGTRYWTALHFCMGAGFIGLMCAYTASTMLTVRASSIFVVALVAVVLVFTGLHAILHRNVPRLISRWWHCCPSDSHHKTEAGSGDSKSNHSASVEYRERYRMCKYLMLLGILAASVTYQAGLVPPGGVWPADGNGHGAAGDPVLRDTDTRRYRMFFYSNSASFVASVVVIVVVPLLMQGALPVAGVPMPVGAMYTVVVLDLLGLLLAYATGSSRDWATSWYVLAMAATVLAYVAIYKVLSSRGGGNSRQQPDQQQVPIRRV
jgi:hypothetical protein